MTDGIDLDELLIARAAGRLAGPASVVVDAHLRLCPESRRRYRLYEALGGLLLEELPPEPLPPERRQRMLAMLGEARAGSAAVDPPREATGRTADPLPAPLRIRLPAPLDCCPWRRSGALAELPLSSGAEDHARLRLLRLDPGAEVPEHGHRGLELTLVLEGRLCDGERTLGPGDLAIADASVVHAPRAGEGEGCLCLLCAV